MEITPLHPTFGALVLGLEPTAPDDDPRWNALRDAFAEHRLLVADLPGLTDEQHVRLVGQLGPTVMEGIPTPRPCAYVSNVRPDGILGERGATWHLDFGFFPHPYEAISLYGVEIPEGGTITRFADAMAAAADLPSDLRRMVAGRDARHVVDVTAPQGEEIVRVRLGRLDESYPHQYRPVLWPHRTSGREILAVCEQHTDAIVGLSEDESTEVIERLFAHLYADEHVLTLEWVPGRLVVWDNHALQHSRPRVEASAGARTLRRVCVGEPQDVSVFANYAGRRAAQEPT